MATQIQGAKELKAAAKALLAARTGELEVRLCEVLIEANRFYARHLKPHGLTATGVIRAARPAPAPKAEAKSRPKPKA